MITCPNCGQKSLNYVRICAECGTALNTEQNELDQVESGGETPQSNEEIGSSKDLLEEGGSVERLQPAGAKQTMTDGPSESREVDRVPRDADHDTSDDLDSLSAFFFATETGIVFKRPQWKGHISRNLLEFTPVEGEEHITIPKSKAKDRVELANAFVSQYNVKVTHEGEDFTFKLAEQDLSLVRAWLPPKTTADLKSNLASRGIGLIVIGIVHFVFPSFLEPIWGGVLIAVGVLNLFIENRIMFIVNGVSLFFASGLNCAAFFSLRAGGLLDLAGGLLALAVGQVIWGLEEFGTFRNYGLQPAAAADLDQLIRNREAEALKSTSVEDDDRFEGKTPDQYWKDFYAEKNSTKD